MQVISFFENLFKSFGDLISFLDTKINLPNWTSARIEFPTTTHGFNVVLPTTLTLSIWQLLSVSLGVGLAFLLALHLYHLVKPIG